VASPHRSGGPVAAIDCGTNSTRLLIADQDGASLAREMRITRLGQGVDATGRLSDEAIGRTVSVLTEFRQSMDDHGVSAARLIATSAVRDAENGSEFLDQATKVVGVPAERLTGNEEGRLAFRGATFDLAPGPDADLVVDIGGGSTELVTELAGSIAAFSMDIGCVRVTERFLRHDPPEVAEIAKAREYIDQQISGAIEQVPELRQARGRLIGLAGTVSTLAALEQKLTVYERDALHHATLIADAVDRWCLQMAGDASSVRAEYPGMLDGRQDILLGGALILKQVMEEFAFEACLVSESDILDGLVLSLLGS
jgi:exopolyphosphatase/guanosine-5'-triphosphate,3'-diphosphate pyrophosphatase